MFTLYRSYSVYVQRCVCVCAQTHTHTTHNNNVTDWLKMSKSGKIIYRNLSFFFLLFRQERCPNEVHFTVHRSKVKKTLWRVETTVDSCGGGHQMSSGFFLLSQWGQWTLRVHLQWKTRPQSSPGDLCLSNQSLRDQTWSRTWSGRGVQQDVVRGNKTLWETTHPARPHLSFKQQRLKPRPSRPLSLWFLQTEATVGFSFYTHTHAATYTHQSKDVSRDWQDRDSAPRPQNYNRNTV